MMAADVVVVVDRSSGCSLVRTDFSRKSRSGRILAYASVDNIMWYCWAGNERVVMDAWT